MSHRPRYAIIDCLRAFAIVLMVIYHFSFDLALMRVISVEAFKSQPMTVIGRSCLSLFLFCVGYSLAISHARGMHWPAFGKRLLKITLAAGAVSLVTWLTFRDAWIYFGILHCIAVSSVVALAFLRLPMLGLATGIALMVAWWGFDTTLPWYHAGRPSLDYIALFPWFGMVLIGIGAHHLRLHERLQAPSHQSIQWLSRHSLMIYLLHQPPLLGVAFLLSRLPLQ